MRLVAFFVLIGVLSLHACARLPGPMTWIVPMAALLPFAGRPRVRLVLLAVGGFAWAWLHADSALRDRLPPGLDGARASVTGSVAGLPSCSRDLCRFVLEVGSSQPAGAAGRRLRLSWYEPDVRPLPSERWRLDVRLRSPRGLSNPYGFDYEGWLFREGIDGTGYVIARGTHTRLTTRSAGSRVDRLRARVSSHVRTALGDRPATAIVLALVTGDRRDITRAQWQTLASTGTGHLMAISGLHVGLVSGFVFLVVGRAGRHAPAALRFTGSRWFAAACALTAALGYALLAGFTLPTRRAVLMTAVVLTAMSLQRPLNLSHSLSAALLAALLLAPMSVLSPGFWLSFGAVFAIGLAFAGRAGAAGPRAFARAQRAVSLGLAPIVAASFGQLPVLSPVANAVLIPLFSLLVVPLVLSGALVSGVAQAAGGWVLATAAWIIETIWLPLEWAASLPWATLAVAGRPGVLLALAVAGSVLVLAPAGAPVRPAAAALLIPLLAWRPPLPAAGGFDLTLLDVGQGLAAVVATRSHTLVYDAGPRYRSGSDAGSTVLVPFLEATVGGGPDLLIVSHGDLDHRGGVPALLARYPGIDLLSGAAGPADGHATVCRAGRRWVWDGVVFEILHPVQGQDLSDNDGSCVLKVTAGGASVLLPGDIEAGAEATLVARGSLAADIVVVPHHGSATSSGEAFVAAVGARYALVSAGHGNRWGFPKPQVVARWRGSGATVLTTAASGAISIRVTPAGLVQTPGEHRLAGRRYWTVAADTKAAGGDGADGADRRTGPGPARSGEAPQ